LAACWLDIPQNLKVTISQLVNPRLIGVSCYWSHPSAERRLLACDPTPEGAALLGSDDAAENDPTIIIPSASPPNS